MVTLIKLKGIKKIKWDSLVHDLKLKIADVIFSARVNFDYCKNLCKDYFYGGDEKPECVADITFEDIEYERALCPKEFNYPDRYLESLALLRKICDYLLDKDGIIFHSSALAVDGNAYLFAAPSGTGKSTHARMWRERFLDKVVMINDDKPIIRRVDGEFFVYGTPWTGKHGLGNNDRAKIKAICALSRGEKNEIEVASGNKMLFTLLNQTIRPKESGKMDKLLSLIDDLVKKVDVYELKCNISTEAAEIAYKKMSGDDKL